MSGGDHVNSVGLAFGTLAVKELINRLVDWLLLNDDLHYLKQGFTKQRGAAFGNASGFNVDLPGLIWRWINTRHRNE